jgi:F-type H+-transporting ATPase subunit a
MFSVAYAATEAGAEKGLSIHLAPEVVGHFFGMPITATLVTAWLVLGLLIVGAVYMHRRYTLVPSGLQVVIETMVGGAYDYVAETLESRELARKYFPIIMTIFIFILALNWVGLLPGVTSIGYWKGGEHGSHLVPFLYPANTDLNITIAFALIAFFTVEVAGIATLGFLKYGHKFINFSSPLAFVIGFIELIGELARLISFSFRLFGNIFAGKTLLLVAMFFVPFVLPVPILAFEVFVALIQALVFALLTTLFIKLAVAEAH